MTAVDDLTSTPGDADQSATRAAVPTVLDYVRRLRERGWTPLPLTRTAGNPKGIPPKGIPPKGVTGYSGRYPDNAELLAMQWADRNVAIRLPGDVLGVDVDVYHGGDPLGLAELERIHGPLPQGYCASSRGRLRGSRITGVPFMLHRPGQRARVIDCWACI